VGLPKKNLQRFLKCDIIYNEMNIKKLFVGFVILTILYNSLTCFGTLFNDESFDNAKKVVQIGEEFEIRESRSGKQYHRFYAYPGYHIDSLIVTKHDGKKILVPLYEYPLYTPREYHFFSLEYIAMFLSALTLAFVYLHSHLIFLVRKFLPYIKKWLSLVRKTIFPPHILSIILSRTRSKPLYLRL
jgi:hypothetical protein